MQKAIDPFDPHTALLMKGYEPHATVTRQESTSLYGTGNEQAFHEWISYTHATGGISTEYISDSTNLELKKMKADIDALKTEISELKNSISQVDQDILEIRDIPYKQAKSEISQFFKNHHGETFTAADIEEILGIEFELALQICEELENEGKIG